MPTKLDAAQVVERVEKGLRAMAESAAPTSCRCAGVSPATAKGCGCHVRKLVGLRVSEISGVTTPATGRRWLTVSKSTEGVTMPTTAPPTSGSAWAKIEAGADALVAEGSAKLTQAQAINEVMKTAEGKKLYEKYLAELGEDLDRQEAASDAAAAGHRMLTARSQDSDALMDRKRVLEEAIEEGARRRNQERHGGRLTDAQAVRDFVLDDTHGRSMYEHLSSVVDELGRRQR